MNQVDLKDIWGLYSNIYVDLLPHTHAHSCCVLTWCPSTTPAVLYMVFALKAWLLANFTNEDIEQWMYEKWMYIQWESLVEISKKNLQFPGINRLVREARDFSHIKGISWEELPYRLLFSTGMFIVFHDLPSQNVLPHCNLWLWLLFLFRVLPTNSLYRVSQHCLHVGPPENHMLLNQ